MAERTKTRAVVPFLTGRYLAQIALVGSAQLAAGKLGNVLSSGSIGPVWPASGIALGAVLLFGYWIWPAVAAGAFLIGILPPQPLPVGAAVIYATGTTLAALGGAFLLRRVAKFDRSLSHLRDAIGLIVLGAFASSTVSASIGAAVLYAHLRSWSGFGSAWLIYWLGDSTGVLLVTPVVLTFPKLFTIRDRNRIAEVAALLLLLTAGGLIVFGDLPLIPGPLHVLAFAVLPLVMWGAIRLGMSVTTLSIFAVGTIATVETALGSGPFTTNTPLMNAVLLDVFFGVVSVTGLVLAAAIAEREHAESQRDQLARQQAATEARLRLATIVESSDDAVIGTDVNGTVTDWNKGAECLFGYSAGEATGRHISFLGANDHSDEAQGILQKVIGGEAIKHYETVRQRKDGTRVDVSLTVSPIRDATGRVVGASGIARNVTERKRAEDALRKSEEKFSKAFRESPMILTLTSAKDHRYLDVNETFERITGWHREEVIGRTPFDIGLWANPNDRVELLKLLLDKGSLRNFEVNARCKDGTVIVALGSAELIQLGNEPCVLSVLADITERKQAEQALKESELRFRRLADTAPVLIWMSGTDKLCTYFNKPWLDFTGRAIGEELGNGWAEGVHPEDLQRCFHTYAESFDRREGFSTEYRLRRYDGEYRWILDIGAPRFQEDGSFAGYIGSCVDITARKEAEEALSGMAGKLIEAQEQERARIARELHDDINQRLALLAIEIEQVQQQPPDSVPELRTRIGTLHNQTTQISSDVQKMSHELHSPRLNYLGLVPAVKGFCKEFGERQKVEIDLKSHEVPSHLPSELSLCLFRVVQEALQNAIKHSGVRHFDVQLWANAEEIHLSVSDSGKGFDTETAKRGAGLGLTSMRERVKLVNGELSIKSQRNHGTTIYACVPISMKCESKRAAG